MLPPARLLHGILLLAPFNKKDGGYSFFPDESTACHRLKRNELSVGERISNYYTAKQVRIIFEKLGEPG